MSELSPLHRAIVFVRAASEIAELYVNPNRSMRYAREDLGQIAAMLHEAVESLNRVNDVLEVISDEKSL